MFSITSVNLNGIRSAVRKGFIDWMNRSGSDFVCLQEIKAQSCDITPEVSTPDGYHGYFECAEKKGYSGTGIYTKTLPDHVEHGFGSTEFDPEGRYLQWEFYPYLKKLKESGREFVICGDWNIAHKEIDLKNWKGNQKNSGFLPEERAWLTNVFDELGWVDVYRHLHPDTTGEAYTWWSNRGQAYAKNVGWRIDYQIATPGIARKAVSAEIYKEERFSDHAPLTIRYNADI